MKVSDYLAQFLEERKVRHVFGIIGAGDMHLFDSITGRGYTQIVCVHHEQAASMAVQIYYRTSGTVTAAIVTTGGGSTNALTGVVSAWADSIPCVFISGNENSKYMVADKTKDLRMWGVQGYDSAKVVEPVTKYATRLYNAEDIAYELEKAFYIADSGRPGPCWIDIPMNVSSAEIDASTLRHFEPPVHEPSPELAAQAAEVAALLAKAERPILWLGNGIRLAGAVDKALPLIEATQAPTLVTWAGIDLVDSDHPLVYGRAGLYGQRAANFVLQNCDLIVAIGTRLAIPQVGYEISELARAAQIVHVDIDAGEVEKLTPRVAYPIVADAGEFIDALMAALAEHPVTRQNAWIARCDWWQARYPWVGPEHPEEDGFLNSYAVLSRLCDYLKDDQIVVTDMGTALLSGHQVMRFKPGQRLMTSTGLGEMGYGLPAALAASFARDKGEVMCLNCDGGMMMNLQELQTIVHHHLPIKIFVFNNDGYLMTKHTQKALFKGRYSGTDPDSGVSCPDYSKVAKAFDMPSFQIRTWEDFETVIPQVQAANGAVICEIFMHPEQLFVPKLGVATNPDGSLVSPPLEDLSPLLPRAELEEAMLIDLHEKSRNLTV